MRYIAILTFVFFTTLSFATNPNSNTPSSNTSDKADFTTVNTDENSEEDEGDVDEATLRENIPLQMRRAIEEHVNLLSLSTGDSTTESDVEADGLASCSCFCPEDDNAPGLCAYCLAGALGCGVLGLILLLGA